LARVGSRLVGKVRGMSVTLPQTTTLHQNALIVSAIHKGGKENASDIRSGSFFNRSAQRECAKPAAVSAAD